MKNRELMVAVGLALGAILPARGAQYLDDFNSGTDTNWTRWAPPPATATFTFPVLAPGNLGYELAAAPGTASFFTTARVGSYVTGLTIANFQVSADLVTWNGADEMQMGVIARVQSPVNNAGAFPGCYALVYINRFSVRGSGTDQLRILRLGPAEITFLNDGLGNQGQFGVVAGGSTAPRPGGAGYRLIFTGVGNQLRGQLIDRSSGNPMTFNDGNGNLTDFIHATDSNSVFSVGSAGLITIPNTLTPGVDTTFDNFSAVEPNQSPVAICTNRTVSAGTNCVANVSIDAGSFDPDNDPLTVTQVPPGPYPIGSNNVCLVVSGVHGATNVCCAVVQVVDTTPPSIRCPGNILATNDPGHCSAVVTFTVSASDCEITELFCDNPTNSFFPLGRTTVTCTAIDLSGNTNRCSFTVTVADLEGPVVTCRQAPNPSGKKIPGSGQRSVPNPDGFWQLLAKDNCDANALIYVYDNASDFVAGPYHSGDVVKLSQNPGGSPTAQPGKPPIVSHIHLNGDALIYATDISGNISRDPCLARIPAKPKLQDDPETTRPGRAEEAQ